MKVYFAHGKESGPWGFKISRLAEITRACGCDLESIDYSDQMDPDLRVQRLLAQLRQETGEIILVGSSMGAYVSVVAAAAIEVRALFLKRLPGISIDQDLVAAFFFAAAFFFTTAAFFGATFFTGDFFVAAFFFAGDFFTGAFFAATFLFTATFFFTAVFFGALFFLITAFFAAVFFTAVFFAGVFSEAQFSTAARS